MTRFARAKGSKASNEKAPEEGTPWEVMREQLLQAKQDGEEAKKRQEAENQRIENYENFLKERKVQKRTATWCDFPETEQDKKNANTCAQNGEPSKKKKKKDKQRNAENGPVVADVQNVQSNSHKTNGIANVEKKKKNKNKNKIKEVIQTETDPAEAQPNTQTVPEEKQSKKKKKKNKQKNQNVVQNPAQPSVDSKEDSVVAEQSTNDQAADASGKKSTKKKKNKNKNKNTATPQNENPSNTNETTQNGHKNDKTANTNKQNKIKALIKKKDKPLVDGKPVRRKEITERSFQLYINGKEVELVRFDGFPVMKKDAERLGELRQSMLQKGIPKSEVQRTLKLERRRAEKALARMKRDVCYNCRKGGHNLSDCPDLKSKIPGVDAAEGVCFKCGSTEHRQFECKVQRDKEFRFATCFICKEPGHIARQCPDNPKGLYPNGGCCKLCGDVTHLRKDCPTVNEKKEGTSVKLQTLDTTENIEDIGQQVKPTVSEGIKKPKKIKF